VAQQSTVPEGTKLANAKSRRKKMRGSKILYPDPNFFYSGSRIRIKELKYFNPYVQNRAVNLRAAGLDA
jgi:hypothetical protein